MYDDDEKPPPLKQMPETHLKQFWVGNPIGDDSNKNDVDGIKIKEENAPKKKRNHHHIGDISSFNNKPWAKRNVKHSSKSSLSKHFAKNGIFFFFGHCKCGEEFGGFGQIRWLVSHL